jgi:hypothetical protein
VMVGMSGGGSLTRSGGGSVSELQDPLVFLQTFRCELGGGDFTQAAVKTTRADFVECSFFVEICVGPGAGPVR